MIKNRLKEMRKKHNFTLDDIQKMTGIKRGTYSNYENGNTEPKIETWQKLANFFDVPVSYLQGFGLSNKQAVHLAWKWAHNEADYVNYQMYEILKTFFKSNYSNEELKKIFKGEQSFSDFMNKRFKSVFNYDSLSKMKDQEDLERKLTILAGSSSEKGLMDAILAKIDDIDFKNDSNDRIHEVLGEILNDLFMYIDSNKSKH